MERRTFLEMSLAAAAATRLPRIAAAWRRREQSGRRLPGNEATAPSDQRERPESGLEYPALGAGSPFAPGFLWGAASSAYQIEGAATADGKGESVWDEFVRRPGVIARGDTGREACDFYHR